MRFLLGQLGSNGDCLYATILARQIKEDYPDAHLTWAISSHCVNAIKGNPHVDDLWLWRAGRPLAQEAAWRAFEKALLRLQAGPERFDKFVLSQIWPGNFQRYDGTIRPSILRAYDRPITVPVDSVIVLSDQEKEAVDRFVNDSGFSNYTHRILFECASGSGQSYVTPDFALSVARLVIDAVTDCAFILSSHEAAPGDMPNVFSAHELDIRQNAALTHHATLFVGCGSGLTVAATSTAAKELSNIQLLTGRTSVYASFFHDFEHFGKPADRFIEMGDATAKEVADAIILHLLDGHDSARHRFHRPLPVTFDFYLELIDQWLVRRCHYRDALASLNLTIARYGPHERLLDYGQSKVLPLLKYDPALMNERDRANAEESAETFNTADR